MELATDPGQGLELSSTWLPRVAGGLGAKLQNYR